MGVSEEIKSMLLKKAGLTLASAQVAQRLSDAIFEVTHDRISVNTLKRLLGLSSDTRNHHRFTLDVIARYLGYNSCYEMERYTNNSDSDFITKNSGDVVSAELKPATLITLTYRPNRRLMLRYEGNEVFTVVISQNSKLYVGDRCTIQYFKPGFPLFALNVIRNGIDLGRYVAAQDSGITIVDIL